MKLAEIVLMDFTKNLVLKENYAFLVADEAAEVMGGERGLYSRDTRFLSRYVWRLSRPAQQLLNYSPRPDRCRQHVAVMEGPAQVLSVERELDIRATGLEDRLLITNDSLETQELELRLEFDADFADLFQARGWHDRPEPSITRDVGLARDAETARGDGSARDAVRLGHVASDGLEQGVELSFTPPPAELAGSAAAYRLRLAPGETQRIRVLTSINDPLEVGLPGMSYESWLGAFPEPRDEGSAVLHRAQLDLRALLLFSEEGPVPAAGIPWFVTAFGRDSILTALMLLPYQPKVARGTLRYLAARQGTVHHAGRAEAPGKILHEVRQGELARTGKVPFGRYYGSIDATLLFVILLHRTFEVDDDASFLAELAPNLEAALKWLDEEADLDGDGFVEFSGAEAGTGLSVQSWKDSYDALSHADGRLATGAVAVSEVQGYAYAALNAGAACMRALGRADAAERLEAKALRLKERFHEAFWVPELGTYALALDHDKTPLRVLSSDAGQLLWAGIVPEATAPELAATLMSEQLFSGWGIRTLGLGEARYNPLSYHNGSVWPHDTALIAAGLRRYGFEKEALTLRGALFDLAASQADLRPPELVAGYARSCAPPVPYPVACRPQAWSSAALVYMSDWES